MALRIVIVGTFPTPDENHLWLHCPCHTLWASRASRRWTRCPACNRSTRLATLLAALALAPYPPRVPAQVAAPDCACPPPLDGLAPVAGQGTRRCAPG